MASIPVRVLTGFLGRGKRTILNAAMATGFDKGAAAAVNEFGDAGIDQNAIQTTSNEAVVLKNDRVCRRIRDDATRSWIGIHRERRLLHAPVHLALEKPPESGTRLVFIIPGLDPARIARSWPAMSPQRPSPHDEARSERSIS